MAAKKIIKKGKKAGGKIIPGDGEQKGSPKVSPKTAPKVSPKTSPKTSPKVVPSQSPKLSPKLTPTASPKDAKKLKKAKAAAAKEKTAEPAAPAKTEAPNKPGKAAPRPPPTPEEKQKATTEVIRIIKEGLKREPEVQAKGICWIPKEWSTKWKPILGPYRKFVESCACFQVTPSSTPSNFTIEVVKGAADGPKADWEVFLSKAASLFSQTDKDKSEFTQLAQALANSSKGEKRKAEAEPAAKSAAKKKLKNKAAKKAKGGEEEDE
eukprot:Skav222961  [mRNA]  locus=scaffold1489:764463:770986:- [translate_table: standard]